MIFLLTALIAGFTGPAQAQDAAKGKATYTANCMACHGDKGDGNGPAAIALTPAPTNFTNAAYWTDKTDAALTTIIKTGKPGTSMTGFGQLKDADVKNLIAYLNSFKPAKAAE